MQHKRWRQPVAADRGVAASVVDLAVVVAVACSPLVHGKSHRELTRRVRRGGELGDAES